MPRKHPGLAAAAIFSLAVAMALGVVALSVGNTALFLPIAAPQPDRLVTIYSHAPDDEEPVGEISWPDYQFFRANSHVFTDIAAAPNSVSLNIDSDFENREVRAASRPVSSNYFAVLGMKPFLGHFFTEDDDLRATHVLVMTYSCWSRLGRDPHILGKKFGSSTIIGVTPESFTGSFYGLNGDMLTPLGGDNDHDWMHRRDQRRFILTARLRPGVTREQARSEMGALAKQLSIAYPREDKNRRIVLTRASLLPPDAISAAEIALGILLLLIVLLLLLACANVATLLMALAVARRQEAAIKVALGARRWRLIFDFLRESASVCAVSAVLGYGAAAALMKRFSTVDLDLPMFGRFTIGLNLHLDFTVLAFTLLLVLIAIAGTGISPALYASSPDIAQMLAGEVAVGGTRKGRLRNALAIGQIAVCTLVLIGLGLCRQNLYNLRHADVGFSARNLVGMQLNPQGEGFDEPRGTELLTRLRGRLAALPGVEAVSFGQYLPLMGEAMIPVQPPNGGKPVSTYSGAVDTGYFSTFGIALLGGRAFNETDRKDGLPVIVINRKMAEQYWPGRNAVGRSLVVGGHSATVVGVVADSKYEDLDEPRTPFVYQALSQHYQPQVFVVARTRGDPAFHLTAIERAIRAAGVQTPVRPTTYNRWVDLALLPQRIVANIVGVLGALGLLMAGTGLAGAVSFNVSQRRKELGIRAALGARSWHLMRMISLQVARVASVGIGIGIALGIAATVALQSQLYQINPVELRVLGPVGAGTLAILVAVAYLAARPWTVADPMEAVRHQ